MIESGNENAKMMTSVYISIALRKEIKRRGMTIEGAIVQGMKAMDERLTWNAEKEQRLHQLEAFKADIIKQRNVARMKRELEKQDEELR